tara:strand:- start:6118 stop:6363 length:246 start_codon:yes stop_codon:yes gene_type:complete
MNLKFLMTYQLGLKKILTPHNLIPVIIETAIDLRKKISIFGNDYYTKDGTGIRDYIHVNDLSRAHINAIEYLFSKKKESYN